ncbi:MAG: site-specific integrase [Chryseobacterium sp.]|nr:MAG: site-specific integrase [Chryseobacterium sp.]
MIKLKHELDLCPMVLASRTNPKTGKAPLVIRVGLKKCKPSQISISKAVNPENWDPDTKQISSREPNYKRINKKTQESLVDLGRIYDQLFASMEKVTPSLIRKAFKGEDVSEEPKGKNAVPSFTLIEMFDDFIVKFSKLVDKEERSDGTLRQWRSTRKKVIEFLFHQTEILDVTFPQITPMFGEQMYEYLTTEVKEPLSDATAKNRIKKVKQIIKIAVKQQIIESNPIADFQCGGDTNEVIPLENEEIVAIIKKDFKIQRLQEVADAYIFQIFTGFAYQDLYDLRPENIKLVGPANERWLCKHRGKTGVYEVVPMLPIIEEIIEKYKDHPVCIKRGTLLPILSNTHFNGYLKEIADLCGIERDLNTHLARHTFADIMLNLGMPLEDVSKMLGHKSIRTTQRYCKIRTVRIQRNYNKFVRPILSRLSTLSDVIQQLNLNPDIDPRKPYTTYAESSYSANVTVNFNYISKTG